MWVSHVKIAQAFSKYFSGIDGRCGGVQQKGAFGRAIPG
jgi:hypothetical protein